MTNELDSLIRKHQRPLPRYTSYPPVGKWNEETNTNLWYQEISDAAEDKGLDLYIHIPYCEKLCYYCGCNRTITKNRSQADKYIECLIREFEIYEREVGKDLKINSLHFGGGTPNFLTDIQLNRLLIYFTNKSFNQDLHIALELDPRILSESHINLFKKYSIKKVSFGIQDFNHDVQKAINRIQPFSLVSNIVSDLRDKIPGIEINFDLIYGLPKQSLQSVRETIRSVMIINPDTIAYYSYAHLPQKLKNQKLINSADLLHGIKKLELFIEGRNLLLEHDFISLGLDHFARKGSSLEKAKNKGNLKRNFMGHTSKKSDVTLGLGSSAISSGKSFYFQNFQDLNSYIDLTEKKELKYKSTHLLSSKDQRITDLIDTIMCQQKIENYSSFHTDLVANLEYLKTLEEDRLINIRDNQLSVTDKGLYFLRNLASCYDHYLGQNKENKFSSSI